MDFPEIWADTTIFLKGNPKIQSSGMQQGLIGDTVHIQCEVSSIPEPDKITWIHNGQVINISKL